MRVGRGGGAAGGSALAPEEDEAARAAHAALTPEDTLGEVVGGAGDEEIDRCRQRSSAGGIDHQVDYPHLLVLRVPFVEIGEQGVSRVEVERVHALARVGAGEGEPAQLVGVADPRMVAVRSPGREESREGPPVAAIERGDEVVNNAQYHRFIATGGQ